MDKEKVMMVCNALLRGHRRENEDRLDCICCFCETARELLKELEIPKLDPLGEALNSGDGVYRP